MVNMDEDVVPRLFKSLSKLDAKQLEHLSAVLLSGAKAARKNLLPEGVSIGQQVWFKILERDYVTNYVRGWVLSANSNNVYVYGKGSYVASMTASSLLNRQQWEERKKELIESKRGIDPKSPILMKKGKLIVDISYRAPIISEGLFSISKNRRKTKRPNRSSVSLRG
jgi:hypothetical protein